MGSLGRELIDNRDAIEQRWHEQRGRWHPHRELPEPAQEATPAQRIRVIGEALAALERTGRSGGPPPWSDIDVVDGPGPACRAPVPFTIAEVVQDYALLVDIVRHWVEERGLVVSFRDYSLFHRLVFELIAESVRGHACLQADLVSRERGEHLAGVAHQMRTPLSALRFAVDQMGLRSPAGSDEGLARLRRNVDRLSFLVNEVMRLERFKAAELPVKACGVYPARLVHEIVEDHEHEAMAKGVLLVVEVDPALRMDLDPDLFTDVLGNLVQNAVKYTDRGQVRIEATEEPTSVLFRVIDSGCGMSSRRRDELFRPLVPAKAGGVGLGTVIAHRAVVAQGGSIGVETTERVGTIMWFRLPRNVISHDGHVTGSRTNASPSGAT